MHISSFASKNGSLMGKSFLISTDTTLLMPPQLTLDHRIYFKLARFSILKCFFRSKKLAFSWVAVNAASASASHIQLKNNIKFIVYSSFVFIVMTRIINKNLMIKSNPSGNSV